MYAMCLCRKGRGEYKSLFANEINLMKYERNLVKDPLANEVTICPLLSKSSSLPPPV